MPPLLTILLIAVAVMVAVAIVVFLLRRRREAEDVRIQIASNPVPELSTDDIAYRIGVVDGLLTGHPHWVPE